jgi:aminoglycoside 2'-N-acetyltransferase I
MVAPDRQKQGLGRTVMMAAHDVLRSRSDLQFGLLFCEPHNVAFYERIGWHSFDGEMQVDQPDGPIRYDIMQTMTLGLAANPPRTGRINLAGLPW